MIPYAIILFLVAGLLLGVGIAIARGRVDLIHDYHQKHVDPRRCLPTAGRSPGGCS